MKENQRDDRYAFLRKRAEQLWTSGEAALSRQLLKKLDEEQARRFRALMRNGLRSIK